MKKHSLLSFALLLALASGASAAQSQASSEPMSLPTYVVETSRYADAEQSINTSLAALRAQASKPVRVSIELPALQSRVAHHVKATAIRLAKS
jgi:hypothetical protein